MARRENSLDVEGKEMRTEIHELEISARTGKLTDMALLHLKAANGERMHFSYTWRDMSSKIYARV